MGKATEKKLPTGIFRLLKYFALPDGTADLERGPYEVLERHNAITNVGGQEQLKLLAGIATNPFNAANAYIGVGDSTTGFAVVQTDLQASTNKLRKAMDSAYPQFVPTGGQIMRYQATFGVADAPWAWNEVALFNASVAGVMLCRAVQYYGTKPSNSGGAGVIWTFQYDLQSPA